jgi:WhiB family redox-sensing transcriptional regulator
VIAQCRTHALAVGEPYGIWGGLSESERELLLKRGIRRAS